MPVIPTYPGVYVQELPSQVHPITGVTTATTAFIDYFPSGPLNEAVLVQSFADYKRTFGGLDATGLDEESESSYQIFQFFLNGGSTAYVVRVAPQDAESASVDLLGQNLVVPGTVAFPPSLVTRPPVNLGPGQQQQFLATIEGPFTWSLSCPGSSDPNIIGSITPKGLYTAPSVIPGVTTVNVVATSKANCAVNPNAVISLIPISVEILQVQKSGHKKPVGTAITLAPGESVQLSALVQGSATQKVSWSLTTPTGSPVPPGAFGSISPNGLYQAPSLMPYETPTYLSPPTTGLPQSPPTGSFQSLPDTGIPVDFSPPVYSPPLSPPPGTIPGAIAVNVSATVSCRVQSPTGMLTLSSLPSSIPIYLVPLRIKPDKAIVAAGEGVCLRAVFGDIPEAEINYIGWSVSGDSVTPPANPGGSQTFCYQPNSPKPPVTVTCELSLNTSPPYFAQAQASVTVVAQYSVGISKTELGPPSQPIPVEVGQSTKLSAYVFGDPAQQITWSVGPGMEGIVDQEGNYLAPDSMPANSTVAVTATSVMDPSQSLQYTVNITPPTSRLTVRAQNPGTWGNQLQVAPIQSQTNPFGPLFSLKVQLVDVMGNPIRSESYSGLTLDDTSLAYAPTVVNAVSQLVNVVDNGPTYDDPYAFPLQQGSVPLNAWQQLQDGLDGEWNTQTGEFEQALIAAVDPTNSPLAAIAPNIFNILSIPATGTPNLTPGAIGDVLEGALAFCQAQRAFLIVDIPPSQVIPNPTQMVSWFLNNTTFFEAAPSGCGAVYYPRVTIADPLNNFNPREIGVSGTMAGVYASTDLNRGVWKAPAGTTADLAGVAPVYTLKDSDSGILNPLGINAIRNFPVYGVVSWGARTLQGADELQSQWKYVPVRRLAYYIESTLYNNLKWAVFEPNDQTLWSSIVANVTPFMAGLFQQGAFPGSTPAQAFFVQCDGTTTTQSDINNGIVNIMVGFAPLLPAEFVIIQISQIAGQLSS
ncbi:MAG: phage tail sheath C-terminal domain-containing protein [Bryobacteraceae bacterium]